MATFFSKFRNKHIPVLDWNFFSSLKYGRELFNEKSWGEGWDNSWIPIAVNIFGDVVISKNNVIYEIMHGTDEKPKPSLVTNDISSLEVFLLALGKYKGISDTDSLEFLREKKAALLQIKKLAPSTLKYIFITEIDDISDAISELRYLNSKEGKFRQAAIDFRKLVFAKLQKQGRYSRLTLTKQKNKYVLVIGGQLKKGESKDEIREVVDKYSSTYPVEYDKFTSARRKKA